MIKYVISAIAIVCATVVTTGAQTPDKTVSMPTVKHLSPPCSKLPAVVANGTGAYVALQGGVNAAQGTVSEGIVSTKSTLGGFGGLKVGYVFGGSLVRPAVELDGFYNGFCQDISAQGFGKVGKFDVDSGAYLTNALVRFNLGAFQPYAGAGIGGYTAEGNISLTSGYQESSGQRTSWAWQIVGGADYYFTPAISIFAEYKFLNYMDASYLTTHDRFGQHLAGVGVRFHF